ncbi:MAG: PAS domain-containing protein [Sphingomonas sp.]|uniref:HWE histidine kinase domain-containing protein n=1 Tax=Sphingomonas sp. TaxID=28214 RepID=UPI0025E539A6|nr:HWE histidine kinase domain-containing protein [Sphingomonas sp.]MBX9883085.1 PAS domain-containing protein [Sphingomonas sp.]
MTQQARPASPSTDDRLAERPLAELLERCGVGIHRYDVRTGEITWDPLLHRVWGLPAGEPVTYDRWSAAVHPEDRAAVEARVAVALDPDGPHMYEAQYRVLPRDGGPEQAVLATGFVTFEGRQAVRLEGTVQLLRCPQRLEAMRRASEERALENTHEAAAVYEAAPLGIVLFDTDFRFKRINSRLAMINGLPPEAHYGRAIEEILPPATCEALRAMQPRLLAGEEVGGIEITGWDDVAQAERSWLVAYRPLRDGGRHITGFLGTIIDITDRKQAEAREKLLAREVDHRAKNLLSIVQSLATLTRAPTIEAYREALGNRLQALARAHGLLAQAGWSSVDLAAIVARELEPYAGATPDRCTASGPPVALAPETAQAFALVLHELATNAAKYGALSVTSGRVRIDWRIDQDQLVLRWQEEGGPPVVPPAGRGFGSRLIEQSVTRSLDGMVRKDWAPDGLIATLSVPSARLLAA